MLEFNRICNMLILLDYLLAPTGFEPVFQP